MQDVASRFGPSETASIAVGTSYKYCPVLQCSNSVTFLKLAFILEALSTCFCFILPGAYVDDAILSKQGFTNFAKLPSVGAAQGEMVSALSLMTSQTSTLLQRGPVYLTSLLHSYVKQQSEDEIEEKKVETSEKSQFV